MVAGQRQCSIRPEQWSDDERARLARAQSPGRRRRDKPGLLHQSPLHARNFISSYSCSLGWLSDNGLLDWSLAPATRWTAPILERYVQHLKTNYADATVVHRLRYLERAIATLDPEADRQLIKDELFFLGSPGRNRAKDGDLPYTHELLQLGHDIMDKADDDPQQGKWHSAAQFRTGLQCALMALVSWRISELAALAIGEEAPIAVYRRSDGTWRMRISKQAAAGKKKARDAPFPRTLVVRLERYLSWHRRRLCTDPSGSVRYTGTALWVSRRYRPQHAGSIARDMKKASGGRFTVPSSPHRYRKSATTSTAVFAPQHMAMVMPILGQSDMATRDEHYNLACSYSASISLNDTTEIISQRAAEKRRRRRRK